MKCIGLEQAGAEIKERLDSGFFYRHLKSQSTRFPGGRVVDLECCTTSPDQLGVIQAPGITSGSCVSSFTASCPFQMKHHALATGSCVQYSFCIVLSEMYGPASQGTTVESPLLLFAVKREELSMTSRRSIIRGGAYSCLAHQLLGRWPRGCVPPSFTNAHNFV